MLKSRILLVVVALIVGLMPVLQASAASDFTDVPSGAYYETAVAWLVQEGITTGTGATTYSPDDPVTRGQMAAFLWRYAGEPGAAGAVPFTDVLSGAYYETAVAWLVQEGITTGTGATTYSPDDPVTRGQMAAFLWRYAGEPEVTTTTTTTVGGGGGGGGGPVPVNITTLSLPDATVGVAYPTTTLMATGGTPPYTWTVTVGSLPSGLTLDPVTGEISGTPDTVESPTFTVQVEDSLSATDPQDFTLNVVYSCAAQTDVPENECDALVALYNSTSGSSWTDSTGWLGDLDICSWQGVTCLGLPPATTVDRLNLNSNNLSGTIPTELGDLTNLTYLRLDNNSLTGPIPPSLGSLANLTDLRLDHNGLTSSLAEPIPDLSGLTSVQRLNLSFNSLGGPIPALSPSLTTLNLNDNSLEGPIPDLSPLMNLSVLNLYNNQLDGSIPDTLGSLANLTVMNVHGNALTGQIPAAFSGLSKIQDMRLYGNSLSGSIPTELGNLTTLTFLDLAENQLTGPIPDFSALTILTGLFLNDNGLDGSIPSSLGNLTSLTRMDLSHNQLDLQIPDLSGLANLTQLFLNDNLLDGPIPSSLGSFGNLERMDLSTNELSGPVPPELMNLDPPLYELGMHGQTGCLTAATQPLADWLAGLDVDWNSGCPVTITTASPLPGATVGVAYPTTTLMATGGTHPYTWTVTVGSLPSGLNLDPGTGVLSGIPETDTDLLSPYIFTVEVQDALTATDTEIFTLVVAPAPAP